MQQPLAYSTNRCYDHFVTIDSLHADFLTAPTEVRLCADGSDGFEGHHLSGRITDVAVRGRGYQHAIDVNESTRLTGVFADVRAARGETDRLRLDPAGCHLFPADHQTPWAERT
jgi:hypothetical protein